MTTNETANSYRYDYLREGGVSRFDKGVVGNCSSFWKEEHINFTGESSDDGGSSSDGAPIHHFKLISDNGLWRVVRTEVPRDIGVKDIAVSGVPVAGGASSWLSGWFNKGYQKLDV